jgi:hypothetical protein
MERVIFSLALFALVMGAVYGFSLWHAKSRIAAYVESNERVAERAGYEWLGCETTWSSLNLSARTVCLVRVDGKVVDIDNIRAE